MNLRIGRVSHLLTPGYSWCHRCFTTWPFVKEHATYDSANSGCFPLCEKCWTELDIPENRLPYYQQLVWQWRSQGSSITQERIDRIYAAVNDGK